MPASACATGCSAPLTSHGRRGGNGGNGSRISALLLAAVFHGLLWLAADRLPPAGRDFLEPTLFLALEADWSEPAPQAAPPGEATARSQPSAPPEQRLADGQGGKVQAPERPHRPKKIREGKRKVARAAPGAAVRPERGSPPPVAAPQTAVASGQPGEGEEEAAEDLPPRPIHQPPPDYPERARARGWQGTVVVEVRVDAEGRVVKASLAATSGHGILDRAALAKVATWRFQATPTDGRNSAKPVRIPIRFQLNGKD